MKERTSQSLIVSPEKLETVKKALKNQSWGSQKAFADSLEISRSTFSKFLNRTDVITKDYFIKICEALKLDWQEIADLPNNAETQPHEHQNKQATVEIEFATSPTALAPANNAFTSEWWREVCRTMLENQQKQKLTTNPLNNCDKQLKDIYVPLGLVERLEIPRVSPHISAEQGSNLYQEKITPISHQEFFEQVIKDGQSLKSKGRRIANIGEPGAGKTTLLQTIAFKILENYELPVWVDLADLGQNESLEDYILLRWLKEALPIIYRLSPQIPLHQVSEELKEALKQEFCNGKMWLLLDGVDEMPAELGNPLTVISKQLKGWLAEARVVLSCRLNVWDADKNALTDFDVYRNLDFSYPDEVREFIQKWFVNKADKAKGLIAELEQSSQRIQDLIKNPLRLTLLCRTWERMEGKLPDSKAGIYQRLVEAHYQWKDDKQDFEISTDKQDKQRELNKALGELARKAIDGTNSRFRLRESFIKGFLGEPKQEKSLFWWALKLGWLNRVGLATAKEKDSDEKVYAFFHPTFQEYFAALAIDDWNFFLNHNNENPNPFVQYKGKDCVYRIFEPQWKEVFLLWLGRHDDGELTKKKDDGELTKKKEEFIEALINFKDDCEGFYWYRAYFLAAAGLAEYDSPNYADKVIDNIVYLCFGYFDKNRKKWQSFATCIQLGAKIALHESAGKKIINALTKRLKDPTQWFQLRLAQTLIEIDHNHIEAIRVLKDFLCVAAVEEKLESARSLAKLSSYKEEVICALSSAINSDNLHKHELLGIAQTLGELSPNDDIAIEVFLSLLETSNDDFIQWEVCRSFRKIIALGNSTVINKLVEWVQHSSDEKIRQLATASLAEVTGDNDRKKVYNFIKPLLKSKDEFTRYLAANSLAKIFSDKETSLIYLVKLLESEHEDIRYRSAESLIILKSSQYKEQALKTLNSLIETAKDRTISVLSIFTLAQVESDNEKFIDTLIEFIIKGEDLWVKSNASIVLKNIASKQNFTKIILNLKNCNSEVSFDVLWHCAQHLPYPEFYKAWHPPSTHQANQKITGTTALIQSLNQAILPEDIRAAIELELSQKIHPVFIDISEWIDINNPSLEIYDQMTGQGCPESTQNQPDTLQKLKLYFKSLNKTEKIYFLIFYKSNSEPQEIPQTLLTALSKFGPQVALITDQPLTNLNLKQFSPTQPITHIVGWMREIVMET